MTEVAIIDPDQDPRWDEFVLSHPAGWLCHLSGWKRVLESAFKQMRGHYLVLQERPAGEIRAGLPET